MLLKLYLDDKTYENVYNVSRAVTNTSNPYEGTENTPRFQEYIVQMLKLL